MDISNKKCLLYLIPFLSNVTKNKLFLTQKDQIEIIAIIVMIHRILFEKTVKSFNDVHIHQ